MKIILLGVALFLSACTHSSHTIFSYSGAFKLSLPTNTLADATVFSVSELSLKMADGALISGRIISAESEKLPDDFDIRKYPEYILKLKPVSASVSEVFLKSSTALDYSYDLSSVETFEDQTLKTFSVCKGDSCLGYVVKKDVSDHILTLHAKGVTREKFVGLLKEV